MMGMEMDKDVDAEKVAHISTYSFRIVEKEKIFTSKLDRIVDHNLKRCTIDIDRASIVYLKSENTGNKWTFVRSYYDPLDKAWYYMSPIHSDAAGWSLVIYKEDDPIS